MKKYFISVMVITIVTNLYLTIRNYMQFNSTVSIKNTHWSKVHVQIRKRYNSDSYYNKLIFDQYLTLGQSRTFSIDNGDDVLYRRDKDPNNPDGKHFTNWTYANVNDSLLCIVTNP